VGRPTHVRGVVSLDRVNELDDDDEAPKKTSKATIVRRALVVLLVLACAGGWIYTRYLVKKGTLGEACSYDIHCRTEAPRCLKPSAESEGVCSRSCETDGDCAAGIKCIKVELEDRDERGRPLEGGYCFPQALLDARKKRAAGDAGAASSGARADSWLEVPEAPGQLEGELTVERGGASHTFQIKGTLIRTKGKRGPTLVDTATLRVYSVDEEKKTFSASQLAASPGEVKITKTDRRDKVADRECEIWQVDDAAGKGSAREACVVKGAAFVDPGGHVVAPLDKELAVRGVLPLRILEGDKPKLLVTKLDVHPVDASLFTIPKTFKNLAAH
jgi:hypothetical protein